MRDEMAGFSILGAAGQGVIDGLAKYEQNVFFKMYTKSPTRSSTASLAAAAPSSGLLASLGPRTAALRVRLLRRRLLLLLLLPSAVLLPTATAAPRLLLLLRWAAATVPLLLRWLPCMHIVYLLRQWCD